MKRLVLLPTLLIAASAFGQDRASLDRFAAAYDRAEVAGDARWMLAHLDRKGTVGSGKSALTYAELASVTEGKPVPSTVVRCKTRIDRARIVGKRATVEFTTRSTMRGAMRESRFKGRAVLVWKGGAWRILNVDTKPLK